MTLRHRLLLAALLGPPAVAAVGIVGLEGWRAARPRSSLFTPRPAPTLADAIEQRQLDDAYAFIREGRKPDDLIAVRHSTITDGRTVLTTPLIWAAAVDNRDAALMLVAFGATPRGTAQAVCVAEAHGRVGLARSLRTAAPEPPACATLNADNPFLSALFAGGRLQSPNGFFDLIYQDDGNLVLYDRRSGTARWASNTDGTTAGRAILHPDGRLVVYDAEGAPRWTLGRGTGRGAVLTLEDDGDVVVRGPDGDRID